jgi:hypothetical protein
VIRSSLVKVVTAGQTIKDESTGLLSCLGAFCHAFDVDGMMAEWKEQSINNSVNNSQQCQHRINASRRSITAQAKQSRGKQGKIIALVAMRRGFAGQPNLQVNEANRALLLQRSPAGLEELGAS